MNHLPNKNIEQLTTDMLQKLTYQYDRKNGKIFDFILKDNEIYIAMYNEQKGVTQIEIPDFVSGFLYETVKRKDGSSVFFGPFRNAEHLKWIQLGRRLHQLSGMFAGTKLQKISIGNWDVSQITHMDKMFANSNLREIGNLDHWNVSKVENMSYMFYESHVENIGDLSNWNVSNVTNMDHLFSEVKLTTIGNIDRWNVSKVTTMWNLFAWSQLKSIGDLSRWDVSRVTNMKSMFAGSKELERIGNLSHWDVSRVTN
ncbi:MAG: BspA family leucine-rich repeat surface protein, partial [Eubacteriales bacterium]